MKWLLIALWWKPKRRDPRWVQEYLEEEAWERLAAQLWDVNFTGDARVAFEEG